MSTRLEMRTLTRDLSRLEAHDVTDAQLDSFLDEGYGEVVSFRMWPWGYSITPDTITLVSGTDEYALAAGVKRVIAVQETVENYPLEAISQSDWARRKEVVTAGGAPKQYVITDGYIHLWPSPTVTNDIDVYYYEHPTFAALDGSLPPFDSAFHTVLVDWALSRLWEMEEDFEKADDYRARFEIKLNRMVRFYNTEMQDRPMIYGERSDTITGTNMPWLSNAAAGGAT